MKEFPTLKEFLLLEDPHYGGEGSAHNMGLPPHKWVKYYECAKANWERFGDAGPPVGTEVITLRAGHGGLAGVERTVGETEHSKRGPFITLTRFDDPGVSWAEVKWWWLHMSAKDLVPFRWSWND